MSELNLQIKEAIDSFDLPRARELLRNAIKEADAETYYLASKVALDDDQKHEFLEKAVALDPFHEKARTALKNGSTVAIQDNNKIPQSSSKSTSSSESELNSHNMVTGIIVGDTEEISLRNIPVETGLVVTTLRKEAQVFLISRDDYADWFQVLYQSVLGVKYGWIKANQVQDVTINNQYINILDLPITNFELNTRNDIKQAITGKLEIRSKDNGSTGGVAALVGIIVIWMWGAGLFLLFDMQSGNSPMIDRTTGQYIGIGLIVVGTFISWGVTENVKKEKFKDLDVMIERWRSLELDKRSDYEVMQDDQRRDAAIGFAGNVGAMFLNTIISRYVPDRKNIKME